MKYASVYLNPTADRNPREKGKEQQIRRFAECQHSNGSEKYKTELLTTQGNKCSCGKNHTLMPISLIALWFRQRAERQEVWALHAAVLQLSCHLGCWMLALPLVVFAFSFATFQCKTGTGFFWGCQTPAEASNACRSPRCWMKQFTTCVHTLMLGSDLSPCMFLLSHLSICPEVGAEWRSPALLFRKSCTQCTQSKPKTLCRCVVGSLGTKLQGKKAMAKKELNGSKWQSQSNGEQEIIISTSLPGRFMREEEQSFP